MSENNQSNGKIIAIITAITGLIVAITGLVTVLGENGLLARWQAQQNKATATYTAVVDADLTPDDLFPTNTPVDEDTVLPTPEPATAEPEPAVLAPPTCTAATAYDGKAKPNSIVVGFTDSDFWVGYGGLPVDAEAQSSLNGYLFDTSEAGQNCLRSWVRYLTEERTAHWPTADDGKGRTNTTVWLGSGNPPLVGELANWEQLPENLIVAVVNDTLVPQYVVIYECGADLPQAERQHVAFWHAATDMAALDEYLTLYGNNGYAVQPTVSCGGE